MLICRSVIEKDDSYTFNGYKVKWRQMFMEKEDQDENKHIYNGVDLQLDRVFGGEF